MSGLFKTPKAPDYRGAAVETAQADRNMLEQQTWANRMDQNTPFGSTQYSNEQQWDPSTQQYINKWTQNTTLNKDSQRALDAQLALSAGRSELGGSMMGRAEKEFGKEMDWSGFTQRRDAPDVPDYQREQFQRSLDNSGAQVRSDPGDIRNRAEQSIYDRATSRLDPQWEQRSGDLEAKLIAQGLRPGDAAYDREMENMGRMRNDAYQGANTAAITGGGTEASRQFGMQMQGRGQDLSQVGNEARFANQASEQAMAQQLRMGGQQYNQQMQSARYAGTQRNQEIAEMMQKRGFSLNEINALVSGQQVGMPSMPGFSQAGRASGTDFTGAAQNQYGAQMDQFNANQMMMQGLMSGGASVASAGLMG